jgi:hypothetical protein
MRERLTVRPKPQNDESLSSFLLRISKGNGEDFFDIFKFLFREETSVRFRTNRVHFIDVFPNQTIKCKELSRLSDISNKEINKMTFTPVILKYSESSNSEENTFYMSMILRQIDGTNRWFCPHCLKEKGYYKLIWQVHDIEICNIHNVKLENCCKYCNSKHLYVHKEIGICNYCHSDLAGCSVEIDYDQNYIDSQISKYRDWEFLLSPSVELSPKYRGIMKDKAISLNILYISQLREKEFRSTHNKVFSKDMTVNVNPKVDHVANVKIDHPLVTSNRSL